MVRWKSLIFVALTFALVSSSPKTPAAHAAAAAAQVTVGIGVAPVCPYGYFDYAPYDCAPYGYYGPDWFTGGVFIGAGPWFHGPHGFYGHVDNRYDPHHGYHGPMPERGAQPFTHFKSNEARDGHGNVGHATHEPTNEHSAGFSGGAHPGGHPSGGHPR
jgi:hypothetical protein